MALFSKPPAKKPEPPKAEARPRPAPPVARPVSARELAANAGAGRAGAERRPQEPAMGDITVTGASMIEWTPGASVAFEVAQANPGLCAVLENAALMYASGQSQPARAVLEQGVESDHDTRLSPLAWLALFDLLQRAGDKAAFDQLALKYVVQFERSAPAWDDRARPQIGPKSAGGYVGITGKLAAASAPQLEGLRRTMVKPGTQVRVDLQAVTGFDDDGARLLAAVLAEARRGRCVLLLLKVEKLKPLLDVAVRKGRAGGEAAWLLSLELLQWMNDRAAFEDRAVEYAVTFELSPPSWEPPDLPKTAADAATADAPGEGPAAAETEMLTWSGVMTGSLTPQLAKLAEFAQGRAIAPIDMTQVERVDFVCAGALLNTINRIEMQRKSVQIVGATPIVRALLLLIGISPRHFVKKAQ
jgi:ABC-type transporter Mla MlaB component